MPETTVTKLQTTGEHPLLNWRSDHAQYQVHAKKNIDNASGIYIYRAKPFTNCCNSLVTCKRILSELGPQTCLMQQHAEVSLSKFTNGLHCHACEHHQIHHLPNANDCDVEVPLHQVLPQHHHGHEIYHLQGQALHGLP